MNTVERVFSELLGELCWSVAPGAFEHNLTIQFGDVRLEVREPHTPKGKDERTGDPARFRRVRVRGRWHLLTWAADWKILQDEDVVAHQDSDVPVKKKACSRLSGQKLAGVTYEPATFVTTLTFDLGGTLVLEPDPDMASTTDQFILSQPGSLVLVVRTDGAIAQGPGNLLPEEKQWSRGRG